MTVWRPQPSLARLIFPACALLCVPVLGWLWIRLSERTSQMQLDPAVFLLGLTLGLVSLLAAILIYLTWCVFSIRYTLDDMQLVVSCGGVRRIVPLNSVVAIHEPGATVDGRRVVVRWRGVRPFVPGYVVGEGNSRQVGKLVSVATAPVARQVLVQTSRLTLGLSPANHAEFVARLKKAQLGALGPEENDEVRTVLSGLSAWAAPLWSDPTTRSLLLVGLVLNILFFAYLSLVYTDLPVRLPLHWDAQAQPDRIGSPVELLRLPLFAAIIWFFNAVLAWWVARRERAVSLFLLAGAAAAQIVFWAGALSIVLRAV